MQLRIHLLGYRRALRERIRDDVRDLNTNIDHCVCRLDSHSEYNRTNGYLPWASKNDLAIDAKPTASDIAFNNRFCVWSIQWIRTLLLVCLLIKRRVPDCNKKEKIMGHNVLYYLYLVSIFSGGSFVSLGCGIAKFIVLVDTFVHCLCR